MSIQSEITRISGNVSDALGVVSAKGVQVPSGANSDNLAALIGQIGNGIIPFAQVDSNSTSTAYTATVSGITSLMDGVAVMLKNGVVTSQAGFTININNLGAYPSYNNMAAATEDTTIFNVNYTMLFVFDSTRGENGGWICYRGYDSDVDEVGFRIRTSDITKPVSGACYRYRVLFTSVDGKKWVPSNTSTSTSGTSSKTVNQTPIDPFGPIAVYYSTTGLSSGGTPGATTMFQQRAFTFGYAFNRTGEELTLTYPAPVFIKCAPQADGSVIMDSTTPYVQALPSTADDKIYIYLGEAYSATAILLRLEHPVYYHDGTGIRLWTGVESQAKLVSGTNIKTLNGASLLGSGDISTFWQYNSTTDSVDLIFPSLS